MGKFSGYLICTDCDGTLTYEPGKVSEENAKAIKYFQSEGGLFTLATGRFPGHAYEFKDMIEVNAPMVALNGTVLYDLKNENIIHEWTADKEECLEMFDFIHHKYPEVKNFWMNYSYKDSVDYKPSEHKPGDGSLQQFFEKLPNRLYKMLSFQDASITQSLQNALKETYGDKFRFDRSWPEGIEIQPIDSGKGVAVQYMKEHLDCDIHTTIGVGDYENDLSLLECSDIGYAVTTAIDGVKAVADRVTVSNKEHALAAIIYELEKEIDERGEHNERN